MTPEEPKYRTHICLGKNCSQRGSPALLRRLEKEVRAADLGGQVQVSVTSCRDRCEFGPSMNVYPGPVFYNYLDDDAIEEIVTSHFLLGKPVARYLFRGDAQETAKLDNAALSTLDRLFGSGDGDKTK